MDEEKIIEERKEKLLKFAKQKYDWLIYAGLASVVWLAVFIRTRNISRLRDITTGGWTLGPDLDPFLFLRWAKYIVQHGSLFLIDKMRYVPLGFNTGNEVLLHPYLIAWFHKIAVLFGSASVDQSAAIYPVFMFALTVIAFFFFVREIFKESQGNVRAGIIALISSIFLSVAPALLQRTIAGIPEKESSGFFFLFFTFYLFLKAWNSKEMKWQIPFAILAGLSTAGMAFVWGGFIYVPVTFAITSLAALLIGQIDKNKIYVIGFWLVVFFLTCGLLSARYSLSNLLNSTTTLMPLAVLGVIIVDYLIYNTRLKRFVENEKFARVPRIVVSLCLSLLIGLIIVSIVFGPRYVIDKAKDVVNLMVTPVSDRISVTVAENRQPYFSEWAGYFGPSIKGIPLFFWLFVIGSAYLYNHMLKVFGKKEKLYLTVSYIFFLVAIIFSRYSSDKTLNGTNFASIGLYVLGVLCLLGTFGYFYYKMFERKEEGRLKEINFGLLMIFCLFFLSIVSARGAVRLIMMLVPPASIIVAYFVVGLFNDARKMEKSSIKLFAIAAAIIIIVSSSFSAYSFYRESYSEAGVYAPYAYTFQWQKAMSWIRTNTSQSAVFGHWWDYGYWLQSIGNRATVLDGGNSIPYWDYLMGRTITSPDKSFALDFLYAHNTTHFLLDSTDIGKYGAFSSIGSDINYDRRSNIPSLFKENKQTLEKKNSTLFLYSGGFSLDDDIVYEYNGTKIFLPAGSAGIAGIIIEITKGNEIKQPVAIFVYQGQRHDIPLRYVYYNGELKDFGDGVEAGIFIYSYFDGSAIDKSAAMLYLSKRVVNSLFAKLYLYNSRDDNFRLAHSEDDFVVASLKEQGVLNSNEDFVYYQGLRGPIRIWEINYPQGMQINKEYLSPDAPEFLSKA